MSEVGLGIEFIFPQERIAISNALRRKLASLEALKKPIFAPELEIPILQRDLDTRENEDILAELDSDQAPELWRKIESIRNPENKINAQEAQRIIKIQKALTDNPRLTDSITRGLIDFHETRMMRLNVGGKKIEGGIDHDKDLVKLSKDLKTGEPRGLVTILAPIHDVVKYGEDEVYLGLHEAASAALAGEIVRETLNVSEVKSKLVESGINEDEYGACVEAVVKFSEIAVANHGKDEFPMKTAKGGGQPISEERGLYRLFGNQLYVDCYRSIDEVVTEEVGQEVRGELEKVSEGLRELDMTSGISLNAFRKYHKEVDPSWLAGHATSKDYVLSFGRTLVQYYEDMPNVLGVKKEYADKFRLEDGLMFAAVQAVHNSENEDVVRQQFIDAYGDQGARIIDQAIYCKELFEKKDEIINWANGSADSINQELGQRHFKDMHLGAFSELVRAIQGVDLDILQEEKGKGLLEEVNKTLGELEEKHRNTP